MSLLDDTGAQVRNTHRTRPARWGKFLLERSREPLTWQGIVMMLTSFGIALSPEEIHALVALGLAISGAIAAFTKTGPNGNGHNGNGSARE